MRNWAIAGLTLQTSVAQVPDSSVALDTKRCFERERTNVYTVACIGLAILLPRPQ